MNGWADNTVMFNWLWKFLPKTFSNEAVDALKMALDSFQANKKADRERNMEAQSMLAHYASTAIASCKTLTDCGVSITPDALSRAMRILDDDAFFKV